MKRIALVFMAALFCAVITGCQKSDEVAVSPDISKWVGKNVEVQFRRDALGAAAALPISPETGVFNGASTNFYGKLLRVDDAAVTIELGNKLKWIPRDVILYVGLR